jgi:hypothetical protein
MSAVLQFMVVYEMLAEAQRDVTPEVAARQLRRSCAVPDRMSGWRAHAINPVRPRQAELTAGCCSPRRLRFLPGVMALQRRRLRLRQSTRPRRSN